MTSALRSLTATGLALAVAISALSAPPASAAPASAASDGIALNREGWSVTATYSHPDTPPSNMLDGSLDTGWTSGKGQQAFPESPEEIVVDLGAAADFDTIVLAAGSAVDDYARSYAVSVSDDGSTWSEVKTGNGSLTDGAMTIDLCEDQSACEQTSARYLRIRQTSWHYVNWWTIAELNLFTHAAAPQDGRASFLDRAGWTMSASQGWLPASNMLDGTLGTGWTTGDGQAPGQSIEVDTVTPVTFDAIDLAAGAATAEYARQVKVEVSDDRQTWRTVAERAGELREGSMRISLCEDVATCSPVTARYVRVTQTSSHFVNAWTVAEFNLVEGDLAYLRPQATASQTMVAPSSTVTVDVWGLAPGEPVTATGANGAALASTTADAAGDATLVIRTPAVLGDLALTITGAWTTWSTELVLTVTDDVENTDPDPNEGTDCGVPTDGTPSLTITATTAHRGDTLTASGAGIPEGSYRLELASSDGTSVAVDEWFECTDGAFDRTITIPSTTAPGQYDLVLVSADGIAARTPLTITTADAITAPVPTITEDEGTIGLDWPQVDGAVSYEVSRATGKFSERAPIGTVTGTDFSDEVGVGAKYAYYYEVTAIDAGGQRSIPSARVSLETALFGDNMTFFSPSDATAEVDKEIADAATKMFPFAAELSDERYTFAFKPGTYATRDINVGYYTSIYGLGETPQQTIVPKIEIKSQPQDSLTNFWRSVENIGIDTGSPNGWVTWATSQAAPARRLWVNGHLHLDDFGKSASGGFLADSVVTGETSSWSQQQYILRNNDLQGGWGGGGWNHVFVGNDNPPAASADWAAASWNATTVEADTPVIREKPFLYLTDAGDYAVFVPGVRENATGVSWTKDDPGVGESLPIGDFHVARPGVDTAATVNAALAQGKHLLFTPGIYEFDRTIDVDRAGTVVLGLGMATLRPVGGVDAIHVADVDDTTIAGVLFDATVDGSDTLLQVGDEDASADHSDAPTLLADVFTRIGGAVEGKAETSVRINSSDVIGDHFWLWRADHGLTPGSTGWEKNTAANGLTVDGDRVTLYGLFVEHFQEYQTLWRGDDGTTFFYQSELPYDPPTQADYMSQNGTVPGYASYKVTNEATGHRAVGLGVYDVFIHTDEWVVSENGIEVSPGNTVQNAAIVSFGAGGGQNHIINGVGAGVSGGKAIKSGINSYTEPVPTVRATINGQAPTTEGYNQPVDVVLERTAGNGTVQYRVNGAEWATVTGPIPLTAPGEYQIDYRVVLFGSVYEPASGTLSVKLIQAAAPLTVTAKATTRCIAGKVTLTTVATNGDTVPVNITTTSSWGTKSSTAVAPGKNTTVAQTTRAASIPAGSVTVTSTATGDRSGSTTATYPATTC